MNYKVSSVTLHSQDKNRMLDFLSDVLEFDVDQESDTVSYGPFLFQLTAGMTSGAGIDFSFRVNSEMQLQEILRKYHFFLYRKPGTNSLSEKISLTNVDNTKILSIEDIDHRHWRFELKL